MSSLTVALVQLRSSGADPRLAREQGELACRDAARQGADIAVFPEMWQIGYAPCPPDSPDRDTWAALAIDTDDDFVEGFCELAAELEMAIVITYLQRWVGGPRNAATVIDRRGERVLTYAKVHTCDFGMEAALSSGDRFHVAELDLGHDQVQVGVMICYDREFPESARTLMLAGAEVILTPNACALTEDRLGQFRARAYENMVGVAMANYAAPNGEAPSDPLQFNGRSVAYSGIAFTAEGAPRDHTLVQAGPSEGIYLATFDLDRLRAWRATETWGDAYRKPWAYQALAADDPKPVFRRTDSRRRRP